MGGQKDSGYIKAGEMLSGSGLMGIDGVEVRKEYLNRLEEDFKEGIIPLQEIEKQKRSLHGGFCPKCGMIWEKVVVSGRLMKVPFEYFQPKCNCEVTSEQLKNRERENFSRLINAGVKGKYLNNSFENWDKTVDPVLTQRMMEVQAHFYHKKFKEGIGLILTGDVGTGKTHCSISILRLVAKYTDSFLFIKMSEYIPIILNKDTGARTVDRMKTVRMIVFDDFDKITTTNEWVSGRIFEVVDARISSGLPSIFTSNLNSPQEFDDKYGKAITSRLFGYCDCIHFAGKDYRKVRRLREKEFIESKELSGKDEYLQGEL